ncbi:MAG TPA: helix-turn-helix transcriptional regulator [Candidatus Agathobaculum intestinipullorum]|nr:helix-turn-helix transcriptional regulator [Candidatus Agathobaculum intestinipullorum]
MKQKYEINERLRKFIVDNDKKPSAIADKAGISRDIFSRIINSKRVIFANELPSIADAAGISIEDLLGTEKKAV